MAGDIFVDLVHMCVLIFQLCEFTARSHGGSVENCVTPSTFSSFFRHRYVSRRCLLAPIREYFNA